MISGRRHPPKETIRSVDEKRKMDAGGGGYSDNVKSTSGMWNSSSCSPLRVGTEAKLCRDAKTSGRSRVSIKNAGNDAHKVFIIIGILEITIVKIKRGREPKEAPLGG